MNFETITLPNELQHRLAHAFELGGLPESLGRLVELVREARDHGRLMLDDLVAEEPTRHAVRTAAQATAYVNCALDGLLLPHLSGVALHQVSACPHCGEAITVESDGGADVTVTSAEAVLSFGAFLAHPGSAHETVCPAINLFPSPAHYAAWVSGQPTVSAIALPFAEAWALARALAQAASPNIAA